MIPALLLVVIVGALICMRWQLSAAENVHYIRGQIDQVRHQAIRAAMALRDETPMGDARLDEDPLNEASLVTPMPTSSGIKATAREHTRSLVAPPPPPLPRNITAATSRILRETPRKQVASAVAVAAFIWRVVR